MPFYRWMVNIFVLGVLFLLVCGYLDRNPLIGAWEATEAACNTNDSVPDISGQVLLKEKAIIVGDEASAVTEHVFSKDRVVVLLQNGGGYILSRLASDVLRFENGSMAGSVLRRKD